MHFYSTRRRSNRGFTLIELLVVIAIIGILSSVVLASLNGARQRGRDSKRITEIKTIQLALELYFESCREYPDTLVVTANNGCATGTDLGDFINPIPLDPLNTGSYVYTYNDDTAHANYVLRVQLEDASSNTLSNDIDGTVTLTGVTPSPNCDDPVYCVRS